MNTRLVIAVRTEHYVVHLLAQPFTLGNTRLTIIDKALRAFQPRDRQSVAQPGKALKACGSGATDFPA